MNWNRIKEKNVIKFTSDNTESYNQPFTLTKLQNSISKSSNSPTGPDEIHHTLFKELPTIFLKYLLNIYDSICISGDIHIFKNQRSHKAYSYKLIALTSCSCKTLDRMINLRLTCFLKLINFFSNLQTSFRAKSTLEQIVHIKTLIWEAFIKKEHLVAVFFDLEKAYDTWPYDILKYLSLWSRLTIFIKRFLQDQTFQTQITHSDSKPAKNGIPRDSILSVILFMIKIIICLSPEINWSLYVDDFLICYSSKNMATIERKIQQ